MHSKKSRVIVAIISFVMIVGGYTAIAAPAQAASPGCMTRSEFNSLREGDTISWVRFKGGHGRTSSTNYFSDGDAWKSVEFRQCGRTWSRSTIFIDFEYAEHEEYVPDWECFDGDCYDWGMYETVYNAPFELTSKSAYWG